MKNLNELLVLELHSSELEQVNGGGIPSSAKGKNYNEILHFAFGPVYDAAYILGKYF